MNKFAFTILLLISNVFIMGTTFRDFLLIFGFNITMWAGYVMAIVISIIRSNPLNMSYEIKDLSDRDFYIKSITAVLMDLINLFLLIPYLSKLVHG